MSFTEIIILAIGLAMDAFVVSISCGINNKSYNMALKYGTSFGLFQAGMIIIGFSIAYIFDKFIEPIGHWIAFAVLVFIGAKMIYEAIKEEQAACIVGFKALMMLSIATSIDALAAGVGLSALDVSLFLPSLVVGFFAFAFSFFGVRLGSFICKNAENRKYFDIAGGVLLIGLGIKVLIEHFLM